MFGTALAGSVVAAACQPAASTPAPSSSGQTDANPTAASGQAPAAQAPAKSGEQIKLVWDTFRGVGTPWPDERIKAFQEKHPNVTVELRPIPVPNNQQEAYPKMYAMYASNTLGDVFAFDPSHWEFYRAVPQGLIRPLDEYVAADKYDLSQFYEPFVEMQKLNGKLWGLPSWGWSGQDGIIYNEVALQEAGINPPDHDSPEWTLDAIRDMAVKLNKLGDGGRYERFGINLTLAASGATILARAYDNDDVISADGTKALITEPNVAKAFQWVNELTQTDKVVALPGGFEGSINDLFASGKCAMVHSGSLTVFNIQKAIKDEKVAVVRTALFPKRSDGKRPSQMRGGTWNVGSKAKQPDAGWEFIQTLTDKEGTLTFNTIGGNGALVRPDIMDDPYFSHEGFRPFLENLLTAMPAFVPANARGTEFEQTFSQAWAEVYLGKIDFDSGLAKLNDAVQRVLDKPTT